MGIRRRRKRRRQGRRVVVVIAVAVEGGEGGICPNLRRVEEKGKLFEIPFGDRIGGRGRSLRERREGEEPSSGKDGWAGLTQSAQKRGTRKKTVLWPSSARLERERRKVKFEAGGEIHFLRELGEFLFCTVVLRTPLLQRVDCTIHDHNETIFFCIIVQFCPIDVALKSFVHRCHFFGQICHAGFHFSF